MSLPFDFPFPLTPTPPFVADADAAPELLLEAADFCFSTRPEATTPFPLSFETGVAVTVAALPFPFPLPTGTFEFDCLLAGPDADVDAPPVVDDLRDGFFANAAAAAAVVVFGCFATIVADAVDVRLPGAYHQISQPYHKSPLLPLPAP